jgi:hypothetical protein
VDEARVIPGVQEAGERLGVELLDELPHVRVEEVLERVGELGVLIRLVPAARFELRVAVDAVVKLLVRVGSLHRLLPIRGRIRSW